MTSIILKSNPQAAYIRYSAGQTYLLLKKDDKALDVFWPDFIKTKRKEKSTLTICATFWASQNKNLESAFAVAQKVVELSPQASRSWSILGSVYRSLKNFPEALKAFEKALSLAKQGWEKQSLQKRVKALQKQIKEQAK